MNIHDSEHVAGMLEGLGFEKVGALVDLPDLLVVNTCSVRQAAEDKVYGLANKVKELKAQNPKLKTVVMGCMVGSVRGERSRYDEKYLKRRLPWADHLVETKEMGAIPALLHQDGFIDEWAVAALGTPEPVRGKGRQAFINISSGCDNFCTFCVVPYSRGAEISRTKESIMHEAQHLVSGGYTHITLVGQNVNSWGIENHAQKLAIRTNSDEKLPFADLLRTLHEIEGLEKISFISSNPFDFTLDLVDALALPKIDRYLHLAVQSGDDEVLRRMNRRHTHTDFIELAKNVRSKVPDIQIGTDLIVGFPGETEEQFQNTVELCKKVHFSVAFISMYSPRVGTNAQKFFEDDVPRVEKRRRHKVLTEVVAKAHPNNAK